MRQRKKQKKKAKKEVISLERGNKKKNKKQKQEVFHPRRKYMTDFTVVIQREIYFYPFYWS